MIRPHGGWSLLVDTGRSGSPRRPVPAAVRRRPGGRDPDERMGPERGHYLRLVFANEPAERLGDLRARFDAAFG